MKERLQAAQETFQKLRTAVNNSTDYASLKSALLTALADYTV